MKDGRRNPWRNGFAIRLGKKLTLFLLVLTAVILLPSKKIQAAGSQDFANLVIFVKYHGDTKDVFNASSGNSSNWQEIKKMYNTGNGQSYTNPSSPYNNSFSNFIFQVTEEKIKVNNLFPQELSGKNGVVVYELSVGNLDKDGIVSDVLKAINNGTIKVDWSQKMDNRTAGVLDNLTIIVQESDNPSVQEKAFHGIYAGGQRLGSQESLLVYDYNMIHSSRLVSNDASLTVTAQQGVLAHEFLHTLGLPDLYRSSGSGEPVGEWDIMAKVSCFPQYPLSYLRAREKWISMDTITESGTYTLTAVSEAGGNKVFALKTPLSDTELICLEYRKKSTSLDQFEHRIPSSGLLMYRVDKKVQDYSNIRGDNYIYVYRPGVSDPEGAADIGSDGLNLSYKAALDGTVGKGSYGSTDLDADFTQNTLYYSDGSNSGIRISDVKISNDQRELTFTVTFADYDGVDIWEKVGGTVGKAVVGNPCLYADPATGTLYMAHDEDYNSLYVKRWSGTSWQQLGASIAGGRTPALAVCGGDLYLAYVRNSDDNVVFSKWNGSAWTSSAYAANAYYGVQLVAEGDELYGVYESDERLIIRDVKSGTVVTDSLKASDFSGSVPGQRSFGNPAVVKLGGCFYMACGVYPEHGQIMMYDTAKKTWSKVYSMTSYSTNEHKLVKAGQKLYAYGGIQGTGAVLAAFDGNGWSSRTLPDMKQAYCVSMEAVDDQVYLSYYDYADNKAKAVKCSEGSFQLLSDRLGTGVKYMGTTSQGGTIFMVMQMQNAGYLTVQKKQVASGTVTPPPEEVPETLKLVLTPPAEYGDNHVYIDGVEYEAVKIGGSYSLQLPDTSGRAATMYCYNDKGIPVGMYVWKLQWQGQVCKAEPLPGLQDMLSYHGFSIRVQSPAGIRFKSGIDAGLKKQLLAGGVNGCRLKEYGTLFITNENREKYPFVKGGTKVGGGRAYWVENGKVYDKVFETVAGRNRFTSVLINLAPNMYAKDISFRAYAVVECDGQEIIVYGPPVYKSVYTVAKQVQAKGEFRPGSSGYRYVQGIIDAVEGR